MKTRYPGTVPFTPEDGDIFFGRETEINDLGRLVELRRLSVLYGRSGLGKSSLLGAGLIPRLKEKGTVCIRIRFGSYQGVESDAPLSILEQAISTYALGKKLIVPFDTNAPSLWQLCKYIQHDLLEQGHKDPRILLVFDQFEELFSYPDQGEKLADTLSALLHNQMPASFQHGLDQALDEGNVWPSDEELAFWQRPLNLRVLVAIRSDRLSLLDKISDYLPYVLNHRYELQPLQAKGAQAAITHPASLPGDFLTPAFGYRPETLDTMLAALQDNSGAVEPFQLQILCQFLEQSIYKHPTFLAPAAAQRRLPQLPPTVLPDTDRLFRDYYENVLGQLDSSESRLQAQRLIEEGLVEAEEERRLTLDQAQIQRTFGVSSALLQQLVDIRLLRAEPNRTGGYSYELSHDTLIPSILQARTERQQRERIARDKAEAKAQLQRRVRQVGLVILLLFLLVTGGLSWNLYQQNNELRTTSTQILRAYRELSTFIKLDQEVPDSKANVADQMRDLTYEIDRAKRAMRARVAAFDKVSGDFEADINEKELDAEQLKLLVEMYKASVDSLIDKSDVIEVQSIEVERARFNSLATEQQYAEINALIAEAERLEIQSNSEAAIAKYQQILAFVPNHPKAIAAYTRLGAPLPTADTLSREETPEPNVDVSDPLYTVTEPTVLPTEGESGANKRVAPPAFSDSDAISNSRGESKLDSLLALILNIENVVERLDALNVLRSTLSSPSDDHNRVSSIIAYEEAALKKLEEEKRDFDSALYEALILEDFSMVKEKLEALITQYPAYKDPIQAELDKLSPITLVPILPQLVKIEGGTFMMGAMNGQSNERPPHMVRVSTFFLATSEVTNEEFVVFLNSKGNKWEGGRLWYNPDESLQNARGRIKQQTDDSWIVEAGYEQYPVNNLSWYGADAYCKWLSEKTGEAYRLPTEAEWEYAAGGGAQNRTIFAGTNDHASANSLMWYSSNSGARPHPVRTKRPNSLGIFDMSGNVLEWCQDWYGNYTNRSQVNPEGPTRGKNRVLKGGSWFHGVDYCRVSVRGIGDSHYSDIGFRILREP